MKRTLNLTRIGCFVLGLFLVKSLAANESETTQSIVDLINTQQYKEAYALALQNQITLEGEPEFDYAFALAAKANNQLNQAVFALERVLQNRPNLVDARFVLAICYFELGNLTASEAELNKLQNHTQVSEKIQNSVASYLDAIEVLKQRQQKRWRTTGIIGIGFDSNPNNGVAEEFIDIPSLGTFSLFQESLENNSAFADLQGKVSYLYPISQHTNMQFSGALVHAEYADQFAFDRTFAAANMGVQTKLGGVNLAGSVFYRPLWLDGDMLLNYAGASVTLSRAISSSFTTGFDLAYSQEDYKEQQGFDRNLAMLKVWLESNHKSGLHKLSLMLGDEESDDNRDFLDREIMGFGYKWQKQLNQNWQAGFSLDYLDSEYQGINTLFNAIRDDDFVTSDIDLTYAYSSKVKFLGRVTYMSNDSEIPIYEYQRFKMWLGASYDF